MSNFSCTKCPAGFVAPKRGLFACEPCAAGFYSGEGFSFCFQCPSGSVSDPASPSCRQCNDLIFFRGVPDELNQSCKVDSMEILLMALSAVAATCFCFSCLTGFHGRIAIADVSTQGQKLVMTATLSHFLLKQSPKVTFKGTEKPSLDNSTWTVQKLNSFQLTLHGSQLNQVDTSMGHLIFQCPWAFIHTGLLGCPLLLWCLLFGAASAAAMTQLTQSSILVAISLGICAGSLAFAWRCSLRFFEAFIKERSMYYVSSDIVKPLTKPFQLSFVELIGPSSMEWFVSHYWGMTVRHFNEAVRGDHCMITLNVLRCLSPWIDYFVAMLRSGLMGSLELFHLYHHFIILHDASALVPQSQVDDIVQIMEYSNTIEGFYEELRALPRDAPSLPSCCAVLRGVTSSWHSFPKALVDCTLRKAAKREEEQQLQAQHCGAWVSSVVGCTLRGRTQRRQSRLRLGRLQRPRIQKQSSPIATKGGTTQ
eukprot:Skav206411  [mRNA]  locus=scaffold2210:268178:286203:- [translate_table: standard]